MVGDLHQRVEHCRRGGQRATFSTKDKVPALRLARYGLADDGEHYGSKTPSTTQSSTDIRRDSVSVPEARPWYEWCRSAEDVVLDRCKRCGRIVCEYVSNCFDFAGTCATDAAVAYDTK